MIESMSYAWARFENSAREKVLRSVLWQVLARSMMLPESIACVRKSELSISQSRRINHQARSIETWNGLIRVKESVQWPRPISYLTAAMWSTQTSIQVTSLQKREVRRRLGSSSQAVPFYKDLARSRVQGDRSPTTRRLSLWCARVNIHDQTHAPAI